MKTNKKDLRQEILMLMPPIVVGATLRLWSLFFGLPNRFRPDENIVILPSLGMIGGDLDPYDYSYPTLYKYILALIFRVCMAFGIGAPSVETTWQYAAYGFFIDGTFFFQVARVVTALMGVVTIGAVYWMGRTGYGRFVGAVGAWFVAISVLHVRDSHFGVTDVPSIGFLMVGMAFCVQIAQSEQMRNYLLAGVFVGLAASTKYGSILGLVPLGVAHLTQRPNGIPVLSRWLWDRRLWIGFGGCTLAFVITMPYALLNAEAFILYFSAQMRHVYVDGHNTDLGIGWLYHPSVTLRYGLGVLVLLSTLGGLVLVCMRRNSIDLIILSLFGVVFIVIGGGKAVFFRYALPLVPLCCVFAGVFLDWVRKRPFVPLLRKGAVGVVLVTICTIEPLWASVWVNVLLGREDTRTQARTWIETHLHEGLLIANIGGVFGDVTLRNRRDMPWWLWRYMRAFPQVTPTSLADFLSQFEADLPPHFSYRFYPGVTNLDRQTNGNPALLKDPDVSVIITHNHPLNYSTVNPKFLDALQARATLRAEFRPGSDIDLERAVFDLQDAFYYPIGRLGNLSRGGPIIRIWDIKDRPFSIFADARNQRKLLRDSFFWIGLNMKEIQAYDDAQQCFQNALHLDPNLETAQTELNTIKNVKNGN